MKISKSYLRNIVNEEIDATLTEARMSVRAATEAIADRFGGEPVTGLPRQGQGSSRGARSMFTIRNYAIFDDRAEKEAAWAELAEEGEELETPEGDYSKYPPVLWNGVVLRNEPLHRWGDIHSAIGVVSARKILSIDESRGYTDAPRAKSYRSHPKSYQSWEDERPDIADEQDAWRAGGSDLYDKGKEDAEAGRTPTISREEDNSHGHYAMGYRDGRKK